MKNLPTSIKNILETLLQSFNKNLIDDQHGCFTVYGYIKINKKTYQLTMGIHEYIKELNEQQKNL